MDIDKIRAEEPRYWQRLLRLAGYYKGRIDGIRGPFQEAAEFAWNRASLALAQLHGTFDARS